MAPVKIHYPFEYLDQPSGLLLNDPRLKGFIEGYAYALQDVMRRLAGGGTCGKSYDPLLVGEGVLHSYAFDLKDGGRHHPISDYQDIGEITELLLWEAVEWVKEMPDSALNARERAEDDG